MNLHQIQYEGDKLEEDQKSFYELISPPITNTRSRTVGALNLIPDMVSAQKTCTKVERTVYLPSQFKLPQ